MKRSVTASARALRCLVLLVALVAAGSLVAPATTASAAAPAAFVPAAADLGSAPVTADLLPAPQINGVVWKQIIVGNTVYVGGDFQNARPFGSAPGVNTVTRTNMLAYNLTTGALDTSFAPSFDGIIKDMAVTPDHTKLIAVGPFTSVDGETHDRAVVFNLPADGSTNGISISTTVVPDINGMTTSVAASNSQIWFGGWFSAINNDARAKVGAVSATDGHLLPVNITIDDYQVNSLALSPDGSKVIIGGGFSTVDGANNPATGGGRGLYLASTSTGAGLPLPANAEMYGDGTGAGVLRVASDSTSFYATFWNYAGTGNAEGYVQGSWDDGSVVNLEDCHGDTYDVAPIGSTVYIAGHQHHCLNSGGFPQTQPTPWNIFHSTAWTKATEGVNLKDTYRYPDHPGKPRPGLLHWFPQYVIGSYTGQNQATWTVSGNSSYVLYGGEFLGIDGTAQQGLARYAIPSISGHHVGPQTAADNTWQPTVHSNSSGTVRVAWPPLWDRDDATLTYEVFRDTTSNVIATATQTTQQWDGQSMSFTDTGLTPGSTHQYAVRVTDGSGNVNNSGWTSTTVASAATMDAYGADVLADGATKFWRLDDPGSTTGDAAGADNVTAGSGVTRGTAGAILPGSASPDTASTFDGTSNGLVKSTNLTLAPDTFTIESWFKTTSTTGGKIMGYGDASSGNSVHYDRHVYMNPDGTVSFGVAPLGTRHVVTSTAHYNDGAWHQVAASLGSGGLVLYVDGEKVGADTTATTGEHYGGFWRVGGDSTWVNNNAAAGRYFNGAIDDFSFYPTVLTPTQVHNHYASAGYTTPIGATPAVSFTSSASGRNLSLRGSATSGAGYPMSSYVWTFGDGTTATAQNVGHRYARSGTYTVTLKVTDNHGNTGTATRRISVVNARPSAAIGASVRKKTVTLSGAGSLDPDGRVVKYTWRFGDGKVGSGIRVSHTYPKAKKRYLVTLTVTDDSGATTVTHRRVKTKKR